MTRGRIIALIAIAGLAVAAALTLGLHTLAILDDLELGAAL